MTLREAYEFGQTQLKNVGIAEATLDAWYLLEHVTGVSRAKYFLNENESISEQEERLYQDAIIKRANRIPLQHITGTQEFMGLTFSVNEHVLVPRQDTEVLVESVLQIAKGGMKILDMCTGSGCILLSLLKLQEGLTGLGVDISEDALTVAKQNAKNLGVDAMFLKSDLFEQVEGQFDIIVSNPPYIKTKVIEELEDEVKLHDPWIALDGMEDGLHFYRKIVECAPTFLKNEGALYFEIGHDQGQEVKQLMEMAGFLNVTVKKDLAGLDRVVFGVYNQ